MTTVEQIPQTDAAIKEMVRTQYSRHCRPTGRPKRRQLLRCHLKLLWPDRQ